MEVLPANGLQTLEFDKIIDLLQKECVSEPTRLRCVSISHFRERADLEMELSVVAEIRNYLREGMVLIPSAFDAISDVYQKLSTPGYVLEGDEIARISRLMTISEAVRELRTAELSEAYPFLAATLDPIPDTGHLLTPVSKVIDDDGKVRPDASGALRRLSRMILDKTQQANRVFDQVVRKYQSNGWLVDSQESVRNDRRVLAVKAEFKRRLRGIVHDQSATGKTAYVEPEELIEINNDLFDLFAARRAEEYRLLEELCDLLRPEIAILESVEEMLTILDLRHAKARLGARMDAQKPIVREGVRLKLIEARHPLLLVKNVQLGKETIPFTLELVGSNRLLLLSGPNAGGKSILLKSVGLLQVMAQCGFLIPAASDTEIGICERICVEIGDQQSIDNDLSTYSSRLLDMKLFLDAADRETLVLIDEFGSGTDPKLGGAIAEAILHKLVAAKCTGVITTHYSELKAFAYKANGVVNGAMIFDRETMSPSYRLRVGKPGSSFAFEIAERTGLPQPVLNYARQKAGKNTRALEELINDLEQQKQEFEEKLRAITEREKQADKLIANYERLQADLAAQRKRFKLEQKERDYFHLSQLNKELEKAVREVQEGKNVARAKEHLKRVKNERKKAREEVSELNSELAARQQDKQKKDWRKGDHVRMRNSEQAGTIEQVDGDKATVIIGQIRLTVPLSRLVAAGEPITVNSVRSVSRDVATSSAGGFNNLLDIRGLRAAAAETLLEKFLDEALLSNANFVKIVHGKGTGVLRKLVERKLREYPVEGIESPEDVQGGSGITIVQL